MTGVNRLSGKVTFIVTEHGNSINMADRFKKMYKIWVNPAKMLTL